MYQPTHISNTQGCTTVCVNVCVLRSERQREERTTSKGFLVSCEIRILSFCVGRPSLISRVSVSKRRCFHMLVHARRYARLLQMLRVFCFSEGSAASHWKGNKSQSLDSSEDTFRGVRKPTTFILLPYGNIHSCCLEWHSYTESSRAGVVLCRADYFQCYPSNFIFCFGGDETEMLLHRKDKMLRLFLKVMALPDLLCTVKRHGWCVRMMLQWYSNKFSRFATNARATTPHLLFLKSHTHCIAYRTEPLTTGYGLDCWSVQPKSDFSFLCFFFDLRISYQPVFPRLGTA